jgi:hypothetical protein
VAGTCVKIKFRRPTSMASSSSPSVTSITGRCLRRPRRSCLPSRRVRIPLCKSTSASRQ